jgi:hypothetical protein
MVPHAGWPADRAVDGAGFVQSLGLVPPLAPGPKWEGGAADFQGVVPSGWLSGGDPGEQRKSLWGDGTGGSFAFERLVEGVGHWGRIHPAGAPRTEWRARAEASDFEGRDHAAGFPPSASATATNRSLPRTLKQSCGPAEQEAKKGWGFGRPPANVPLWNRNLSNMSRCCCWAFWQWS